jgi:hypothetical protein
MSRSRLRRKRSPHYDDPLDPDNGQWEDEGPSQVARKITPPKRSQEIHPTDISVDTRRPITGVEMVTNTSEPTQEDEVLPSKEEAALTIKNIETCVEQLHGLLGDLAKATGRDFTSAMVDVDGIMAAITTSRVGRLELIALEWPEVLPEDQQ